ncbi:aldehyde dehydrogenase [Trametopsis cervina]|nr:aldehyde dehydrogenase [Trametopsis cervina]
MSATPFVHTPIEEISVIHAKLRKTFDAGVTRPLEWRRKQLQQYILMMQENKKAIEHALWLDLRKPAVESAAVEVGGLIANANLTLNSLEDWTAPTKPWVAPHHANWGAAIHQAPKGLVTIIAPWNYPFVLTLKPFIGAIAAGCTVVLKPSEISANSAALMAEMIPKYLDQSAFAVVNGGVPETTALLSFRWDHIMYTGGTAVGRIVATAAAKYVTPITLELGSKCPVFIDSGYDLDLAAKRLIWGKAQNAGQLCVSPDYTLVLRSVYPQFLDALKRVFDAFWPEGALAPDSQWGKIVNQQHADRLLKLLDNTNGKIVLGGRHERLPDGVRIEPTIVVDVGVDDALMADEIFGPIHPILPVDTLDEAIAIIRSLPKTLSVAAFTNSDETKKKLLEQTDSGSLQFGETVTVLGTDELPFGGRGDSGYGTWQGWWSFKTFANERLLLDIPPSEEAAFEGRYLPYSQAAYEAVSALSFPSGSTA